MAFYNHLEAWIEISGYLNVNPNGNKNFDKFEELVVSMDVLLCYVIKISFQNNIKKNHIPFGKRTCSRVYRKSLKSLLMDQS